MSFDFAHDRDGVTLRVRFERTGILSRLLGREAPRDLDRLGPDDRALSLAIADLRAIADDHPGELTIAGDTIRMSHTIAAELGGDAAAVLGMPPLVDLTLRTDVEGVPGSAGFRLRCDWVRAGQPQAVRREGAFLQTSSGVRRLPAWVMAALDVADSPPAARDDAAHWAALARFRHALDPGVEVVSSPQARVAMSEFLAGLEVRLADRLSIAPNAAGDDFEVIPFSGDRLEALAEGEAVGQEHAELGGESLRSFQAKVRQRGALNAYRLGRGSYVVVGRAAQPALRLMAEVQRAPVGERLAFIANPRPRLSAAVEAALRAEGGLEGLDPAAEEEAIAAAAEPLFVETREFSERVRGVRVYEPPDIDLARASGTTWLPEIFSEQVGRVLAGLPTDELQALTDRVEAAIADGQESVALAGERLPASRETLTALKARLAARTGTADEDGDTTEEATAERLIVETKDNFDALGWRPETPERVAAIPTDPPHGIRTTLKPHQIAGLAWQIDAWRAGLPGVLNADEQGLGKTLQTLAFLRWLDVHQAAAGNGKPILVVAPTSLLRNWEQEAERHLEAPGLGHLLRLYGSGLGSVRRTDRGRFEMRTGLESLDFGRLPDIAAGRGWILTTYTTLVNYQHSLARLPLAAIVFDEIQSVKNPVSLRACAARALNADFRIGLTGTPIENSVVDLWAIMDQLAPGTLGTLQEFRGRYEEAAPEALADLHRRLFHPCGTQPALALRRLKDDVAGDLPEKSRRLHPRLMPTGQAQVYEEARLKLASGGPGAALKMLHHIRSVSVHPWIGSGADHAGFIEESARLSATFDILRRIAANRERALVFIEHRQMQHRFVELARATFGLSRIDIINGDTPIARRQQIVDTFQRHMQQDGGFDLLVLGPKAAGVGLTLTAATHVIHLSRWWNPAVEEQCNDRVHRIGQTRAVTIHVPMAVHPGYRQDSSDCLLHDLMQRKRRLARSALWPMGDTSADVHRLQESLSAGVEQAPGDPLANAIERMFERQCISRPPNGPDGSLPFA